MTQEQQNKRVIREMVQAVWVDRNLGALPSFWTMDCVNHAGPGPDNVGLGPLSAYHEGFLTGFLPAFSGPEIGFVQQVAEGDRVVSQMAFRGVHAGPFLGHEATGKVVTLRSIRIDRLEGGKIAEHWSVADMAGFMQQLRG